MFPSYNDGFPYHPGQLSSNAQRSVTKSWTNLFDPSIARHPTPPISSLEPRPPPLINPTQPSHAARFNSTPCTGLGFPLTHSTHSPFIHSRGHENVTHVAVTIHRLDRFHRSHFDDTPSDGARGRAYREGQETAHSRLDPAAAATASASAITACTKEEAGNEGEGEEGQGARATSVSRGSGVESPGWEGLGGRRRRRRER